MLVTSSCPNVAPYDTSRSHERHFEHTGTQAYRLLNRPMVEKTNQDVEIHPADVVKRRVITWDGMAAEIVQATRPFLSYASRAREAMATASSRACRDRRCAT